MISETIINSALAFLKKAIDSAAQVVAKAIKETKTTNTVDLQPVANAISKLERAVTSQRVTADVSLDTSVFEAELAKMTATVAANKPQPTDTSDLSAGLKVLALKMDDQTKQFGALFSTVTTGLENVNSSVKLIKPKDTFKLDDMQLRALSTGGSGGTPGGAMAPRTHNIRTIPLANANEEYTVTLSPNCVGYFIRNRALNIPLLLASAAGKLPTSGDGLAYLTIPQNGYLSPMGLDVGGNTLYLQAASASQNVEIIEYIA